MNIHMTSNAVRATSKRRSEYMKRQKREIRQAILFYSHALIAALLNFLNFPRSKIMLLKMKTNKRRTETRLLFIKIRTVENIQAYSFRSTAVLLETCEYGNRNSSLENIRIVSISCKFSVEIYCD